MTIHNATVRWRSATHRIARALWGGGDEQLAHRTLAPHQRPTLSVTSPKFVDDSVLPLSETPPTLVVEGVPRDARTLVVICEQPDSGMPEPFVHWLVFGLSARESTIDPLALRGAMEGKNSKLHVGYAPPAASRRRGTQHYHFQVFALDDELPGAANEATAPMPAYQSPRGVAVGAGRSELVESMRGHVLAWGEIVGTSGRDRLTRVKQVALMTLLAACAKDEPKPGQTVTTASKVEPVRALAGQWNRAVSQRDLTLLSPIYGETVSYYGAPLRHDQVLQIRSDAFVIDPSFTQEVRSADVVSPTRVEIARTFIRFGKKLEDKVWLDGAADKDGRWVVVAEGDDASEQREAARDAHTSPSHCDDLALRVARSTTQANALIAGSPDHVTSFVVATPPTFPVYAVAMTVEVHGAPTTVAWYDVSPCFMFSPAPNVPRAPGSCVLPGSAKGAVTNALTGEVLSADAAALVAMSKCP